MASALRYVVVDQTRVTGRQSLYILLIVDSLTVIPSSLRLRTFIIQSHLLLKPCLTLGSTGSTPSEQWCQKTTLHQPTGHRLLSRCCLIPSGECVAVCARRPTTTLWLDY
uniref:Uncharacterized protein n=1 Tax=Daphnia galeata TaxID=27404 RepID=A0A8J2RE43_9CRUS|nr:unnamed protein product [Daphnia galeata]